MVPSEVRGVCSQLLALDARRGLAEWVPRYGKIAATMLVFDRDVT